ncbi:flagellar filament capping protein FliD [Methylocaldum sp.]|uniref:flagellar filament capping protein FliD n=1 Tax=Methylocaldum sp. TaxID=1969727 RepID=UPI002D68E95A|nr:flagellar filament capping protein FliD [Methylocaldum sp.]HYE35215.1 flagellar filament capping protein FliD [Methylocaldum sp.]
MERITSTGLGSGLNISSMVSQLVQAERAPISSRLDRQEAEIQSKISSFGNFKSALSTFRDSLSALKNLSNFQKINATSSDSSIVSASAESNADLGNYKIEVKQLAQSHALATSYFASANAVVGTGTLTLKFGTTDYTPPAGGVPGSYNGFTQNPDKGTLTLTIDSTNNTLSGIRDAINNAKTGVTAAIVSDSGGSRLVLNSSDGGVENSLQISVTDNDGNSIDASGLSVLSFDASAVNLQQTQPALDAKIAINGLEVSSSSNTIKDALKGVTLNLQSAQPGKLVNVSISQSNDDIKKLIEGFVKGFNELAKTDRSLTGYDAAQKAGGILQGDPTVRGGMAQLRSELGRFVQGLEGSMKTLADIGIRTQRDGTLSLDSSKLNQALALDRSSVAGLFAAIGRPTDSGIVYSGNTADTKPGTYAVNITQAATQGFLNGGTVNSLVVDADNDTFKIKVDGVLSADITLTQATYSNHATLAAEIQSRINGDSALKAKGLSVGVNYDSGTNRFVIQSKNYGSASQVEITQADINSEATLGLRVGSSLTDNTGGKDVAGSIGGLQATGEGQELTGTTGDAQGLKLLISDTKTGDRGEVNFSRGLIERLDKVLSGLLDSKGAIKSRTDGLQKSLDKILESRESLESRMSDLEKRLLDRFNRMDLLLGRFQAVSSYLGQQLATLPLSNQNKK